MDSIKSFFKPILITLGFKGKDRGDVFSLRMNKKTLAKLFYFKRMLDRVASTEGDVVECGVGKAVSAQMLSLLIDNENQGRKFYGFDSFEGFPEPSLEDSSFRNPKKGEWKKMSKEDVYDTLLKCRLSREFISSNIKIIKGFFDQTLPVSKVSKIALLHLDVDLYKSYKDCLEHLFPKVVKGGVVIFDEYDEPKFPGAKKAIDEYFADTEYKIEKDTIFGKRFLIKQ